MKIVILGYMGSGKSTIGRQLSKIINMNYIDLDDYIELKEGLSVSKIFKAKGEIYFRKSEHKYLKEIIKDKNDAILSLGGGTPCYSNNMSIISQVKDVKSFYLKGSVKTLSNRLINETNNRPLLQNVKSENELLEFVGKHLFERNSFYNQADFKITIDNKSKKDIIEELILHLF